MSETTFHWLGVIIFLIHISSAIKALEIALSKGRLTNISYILITLFGIFALITMTFIEEKDKKHNEKIHPLTFFTDISIVIFLFWLSRYSVDVFL